MQRSVQNPGRGKSAGPSRKPGFREVAQAAGVSVTTVERVLNERGSVSAETRLRVVRAAQALEMRRILPEPGHRNLIIETILLANPTAYWGKLADALRHSTRVLPRGVTLHRTIVPEGNPAAMINAIERSSVRRAGLIVAAEVGEAIGSSLRKVMQRGEIVVSISSIRTAQQSHAYSGIDNIAAGRTAASLINFGLRSKSGLVLVLQGSDTMQSHNDRVIGFRQVLDPAHTLTVRVTQEVDGASYRTLASMLSANTAPLAIYETGDPGDEIAPLVNNLAPRPIWIGHERNAAHDRLMREGLLDFVLDQDPAAQVKWAVGPILSQLGTSNANFAEPTRPELRLFCAANLSPS